MRKISIYLLKLFFTRDKDFVPLAEVPVEGFASSFKKRRGLGTSAKLGKLHGFVSFQSFRGLPLLQTTKTSLAQE